MASIHDVNENIWVWSTFTQGVWSYIGMNDAAVEGTMTNTDGTFVDFYYPKPNYQFDDGAVNEDCVHLWSDTNAAYNYHWNDIPCATAQAFVCKKLAGCGTGNYYTGGSYKLLGGTVI